VVGFGLVGVPAGEDAQRVVQDKLKQVLGSGVEYLSIDVVGPKVSGEYAQQSIIAVLIAIIGILIYVWFRFEWQFAIATVMSLLHDVLLTIGFFCLIGIDFNLQIIAAITHGTVIRKILRHLQLAADPPSIAPPRVRQAACACSSTGRAGVSQTPPGALARGDHTALPGNVCLPATWRRGRVVSSGLHNPDGACPTGLWHNSVCNSSTPTGLASLSFIIHSSSFRHWFRFV